METKLIESQIKFKINPSIVDKRIGNETLLINLLSNQIYSLNTTATRLWELLLSSCSREEIFETLLAEFEVSQQDLAIEIDSLLSELQEKGFIVKYFKY